MPKKLAKDRAKRPDSKKNAMPKKIHIVHGGASKAILTHALDGRTKLAKAYKQHVKALESHLCNDLTKPQTRLIDHAARLALLSEVAWSEAVENGFFREGIAAPALDTFIKATKEEREILKLLGIGRKTKPVPSLEDYIEGNGHEHNTGD